MFNIIFKEKLTLIIVLFYLKWYNQAFTLNSRSVIKQIK